MGPSARSRPMPPQARACLHCQKRKSRCLRDDNGPDGAPCLRCARTGKTCSFEEPPARTPLTRKNLDAAEQHCAQLRALIRSLHPHLDIDDQLRRLESGANGVGVVGSPSLAHASLHDPLNPPEQPGQGIEAQACESDEDDDSPGHEFEWHESATPPDSGVGALPDNELDIKDGMANLSSLDAGYLGSSSGSNLLREISSMLPELAASTCSSESRSRLRSSGNRNSGTDATFPGGGGVMDFRAGLRAGYDPPSLASSAITSRLIDAYFLFYNVSYPILHEPTFRARVASKQQQSYSSDKLASRSIMGSPWQVIYYMVLAFGHWISTTDDYHAARSGYYAAARAALSIRMLESGTIETVQAFLLMGNYIQKRDRPNTGYNFIGIAYRMALGLGLHRETKGMPNPKSTSTNDEAATAVGQQQQQPQQEETEGPEAGDNLGHERLRQLFWTVYCFDSGLNITTGRPPCTSEGVIDTRLPLNIQDTDLAPSLPIPEAVDYPTTLSALIAHAQLARIANIIYHEFLLSRTANAKMEYQVAESLERSLTSWVQSLPAYFFSPDVPSWFFCPRAMVLWKEQNLRILLWRGSRRKHGFLPSKVDAERRCLAVAMQSVHDITQFCAEYEGILHLSVGWYATYFLFQAALALEASYLNHSKYWMSSNGNTAAEDGPYYSHQQPHHLGHHHHQRHDDAENEDLSTWQASITKARECLARLARKSRSARRCLEVLDLIHSRTRVVPSLSDPPHAVTSAQQDGMVGGGFATPIHPHLSQVHGGDRGVTVPESAANGAGAGMGAPPVPSSGGGMGHSLAPNLHPPPHPQEDLIMAAAATGTASGGAGGAGDPADSFLAATGGIGLGYNDDTSDPTLRMIMGQTPLLGHMDNLPVDALFDEWCGAQFDMPLSG